MSDNLDTEVRELLEARRGDWRKVCAEMQISHSWVSQFVRNKITNPGYLTLRDLRVYLKTGKKPAPAEAQPG